MREAKSINNNLYRRMSTKMYVANIYNRGIIY